MKPTLHGVRGKDPEPHPIIEITGQLDVGKASIAEAVARGLKAPLFAFPVLDHQSFTGRALLWALAGKGELLEQAPQWWAHLYIANLLEKADEIYSASLQGPVIVTNYTTGFSIWMHAAGIKSLGGFFASLPPPKIVYKLCGSTWITARNLHNGFSTPFILKIGHAMLNTADKKVVRINLLSTSPGRMHQRVNEASSKILEDLKRRYNLSDSGAIVKSTDTRGGSW